MRKRKRDSDVILPCIKPLNLLFMLSCCHSLTSSVMFPADDRQAQIAEMQEVLLFRCSAIEI